MRVCMIGGGKVGYYLAKNLLEHGHEPVMIEKDKALASRAANELEIGVICGDGTNVEILEQAGVGHCSVFISATGRDEDNLIACQLAKKVFGVEKTLARVNNPKNVEVLKKLGVDIAVSSTENISTLLEREAETTSIRHLLSMDEGNSSLTEVILPEKFRYNGKTLAEITLPEDVVVAAVYRDNEMLIPRGSTQLYAGDKVVCIAKDSSLHELVQIWKLED